MSYTKKFLVAPLNWGLGHATRCVPIIQQLVDGNAEVTVASDGDALVLLQEEFPDLPFLELPGYHIRYQRGSVLWPVIFRQIPQLRKAIKQEQSALQEHLAKYTYDHIISDNRYGIYDRNTPSIFITHQLRLALPFFQSLGGSAYKYWLTNRMRHFQEIWVPDFEEKEMRLTGKISLPGARLSKKVRHIGPLSRLTFQDHASKEYDVMILLSGPEPQRSILENKLLEQLDSTGLKCLMAGGQFSTKPDLPSNCRYWSYMNKEELMENLAKSAYVIARGGYSTIMDLISMRQPAVLIPTPGQPEQKYLAEYLKGRMPFVFVNQKDIQVTRDLKKLEALSTSYFPDNDGRLLKNAIRSMLPE